MKKITKIYKNFLYNFSKKTNLDRQLISDSSLDYLFNHFGTDKGSKVVDPYSSGSSQIFGHGFSKFYEKKLGPFKDDLFNILEIGTWKGASVASFLNYFPQSNVFGIDKNFKCKVKSKRFRFLNCNIRDVDDLKKLEKKINNKLFKVIIDDGSHSLKDMIFNLRFFFKYLENEGFFIIEDFNSPIYFEELNDAKNSELFIHEILEKIKKKKKFKSDILDHNDQDELFNLVEKIEIFKGKTNESDIVFIKKKK